MKKVTVCLDSGKLATGACMSDVRSASRVASALIYPEDYPTEYCNKHVMATVCSGGGTPNEYCKLFAARENQPEDDKVTISKKALVKMTKEELQEIRKASGSGLASFMYGSNWISGSITTCKEHTKESWEAYLNSVPPEPEPTEGGDAPVEPTE